MRALAVVGFALVVAGCSSDSSGTPDKPSTVIKASDGAELIVNVDQPPANARGVILLFHQAKASSSEYVLIAPRLVEMGFVTVAVDQRSGGDTMGVNQTVRNRGGSTSYLEAYPDFEGALAYAKDFRLPIVAWGSSYSASMVFKLAAEHPEVAAAVAFSPGEYFDKPDTLKGWVADCKSPAFVACMEAESPSVKAAVGDTPVHTHQSSQHGSLALYSDASEKYWAEVTEFLDKVCPQTSDPHP